MKSSRSSPLRLQAAVSLAVIIVSCPVWSAFAQHLSLSETHDYTDAAQLAALISKRSEPYIPVDVRTAEKYAAGHIPSASNIPNDRISKDLPAPDKTALIIVYCRSGGRASKAAHALRAAGYTKVVGFRSLKGPKLQIPDPGDCPCLNL